MRNTPRPCLSLPKTPAGHPNPVITVVRGERQEPGVVNRLIAIGNGRARPGLYGTARCPKPVVASAGEPRADLRVDVPLVMIPVHVTTPLGVSVTGLKKEKFRLFEDGVEQKVTHFSNDDAPLSVGFLLDASSSMRNKMRKSVEAAGEFLKDNNPEDEFFLIPFGEWPKPAVPMTKDLEQVRMGLVRARPIGRTSLLDAIHLSLLEMRHAHNLRKAIVILSDGYAPAGSRGGSLGRIITPRAFRR
jgi:hypothetical protein